MGAFPLMPFALGFYNLLAFGGGMAGKDAATLLTQPFPITMPSGDVWSLTGTDVFVTATFCLLFVEILKATRTGRGEILNHAFSTLTFLAALVEFLLLKGFTTSAFFLLVAMCLFDVLAGYTISIVSARRDFAIPGAD